MTDTLVWAPRPLKRLRLQTGFVACDEGLAKELLAEDLVQDPAVGALLLRPIEDKRAELKSDEAEEEAVTEGDRKQTYTTRQLRAKK